MNGWRRIIATPTRVVESHSIFNRAGRGPAEPPNVSTQKVQAYACVNRKDVVGSRILTEMGPAGKLVQNGTKPPPSLVEQALTA
jgi:hypothetical protein